MLQDQVRVVLASKTNVMPSRTLPWSKAENNNTGSFLCLPTEPQGYNRAVNPARICVGAQDGPISEPRPVQQVVRL